MAQAAAEIESGPEFALLQNMLSDLAPADAQEIVDGFMREDALADLKEVIRAIATRTEEVRASDVLLSSPMEVLFAGRIAEMNEHYVVLTQIEGGATVVPRWMAGAVKRDQIGAFLALVADKLDFASAVVEALPAIEINLERSKEQIKFSPFGRDDPRTRRISSRDARLLAGEPQPLRILLPVTIDG